jgi:tetratricopeptide (TPR) repeat protein
VEIGPGKLADPVVCATAPELSYALYLPVGYDAETTWPVVFLFDAEGRGAGLAERYRRGADRFGFALVASNDVARDTPWEINQRVVRILLADAFRHVAIDSSRLHFAGFGGTARLAWSAGLGFRDAVTGVLLMGGTTPGSELPDEAPPFPVFSITATEDFNHDEVVRFDATLDELSRKASKGKGRPAPHRLAVFEGANEWPPEDLATRALGWFELRAMQRGQVELDPERVSRCLSEDLQRAGELEQGGDLVAATDRYRAIVRDYEGLVDPDDERYARARSKADEMGQRGAVKKARRAERKRLADAEIYRADLAGAIIRLRNDRNPPQPNRLLTELKIPLLQEHAESGDPEEARNARRMLELAYVYTSLYLPSELMARGLYRHAASSLIVASEIHPEEPKNWLGIARAFALAGEHREALDALERARATGARDEEIAADEVLAALTQEE